MADEKQAGVARKDVRVTMSLTPELHARFSRIARARAIPLSVLIKSWAVERLDTEEDEMAQGSVFPAFVLVDDDTYIPVAEVLAAPQKYAPVLAASVRGVRDEGSSYARGLARLLAHVRRRAATGRDEGGGGADLTGSAEATRRQRETDA